MKGLTRFRKTYDVIVVGSGNGGMAAALKCARGGLDTLLLEQHNMIGGYATSYVRGRYEFEASLHELCEFGNGELDKSLGYDTPKTSLRRFYEDECGIDMELRLVPDMYNTITSKSGIRFKMPFGEKNVVAAVEKLSPGDGPKVEKYLALCREIYAANVYMDSVPEMNKLKVLAEHNAFIRMAGYSVAEVNKTFGFSSKTEEALNTLVGYVALDINELSFAVYAIMLHMYIAQGAHIPLHTSHEIATRVELALRRMGAQVECCCKVERFITKDGRVTGVITADGDEIQAKYVVCNANPTLAATKMLPAELVPERLKKLTSKRELTCNVLTACLGLDDTPEHLGITCYESYMGEDMDRVAISEGVKHWRKPHMVCGTCPDVAIPGHTGPDRCQLNFTILYYTDAMEEALDKTQYAVRNEEIVNSLIDMYEKYSGATIRGHIEECAIASPATFTRYCNSFRGDIYGFKPTLIDSIITRSMSMEDERLVPGMVFCGAGSFRGSGYDCAMMSGLKAGEYVSKEIRG